MSIFHHENLHRTAAVMQTLKEFSVTLCGAGALGANIAENLARQGFARLRVIDRDRIEERNLSTQPYYRGDIGAFKAKILANSLFRALGVSLDVRAEELTAQNVGKLLQDSSLVIDAFDNSVARRVVTEHCAARNQPCLHVGLASDYAEILWNEVYRVPSPAQDDVCDYPLARNLVLMTVAIACEVIVGFAASGERRNLTLTLGDFAVRPFDTGFKENLTPS
jgi:molybdopterin-synthase adenylyltransferase